MSIIRAARPESNFYILDKSISEDSSLSWEARGMLIYLLGKPDNWEVSVKALIKQGKAGRDKVYSILKELINAGYVIREAKRGGDGRLGENKYIVSEKPHTALPDTVKTPLTEKTETDEPDTDEPDTELPDTDKPYTANPTQVSIEYKQELNSSKDLNNTNPQSENSDPPKPKKSKSSTDYSPLGVTAERVEQINQFRKNKRLKPMTQNIVNRQAKELIKARQLGWSDDEIFEHWEFKGWGTLEASWLPPKVVPVTGQPNGFFQGQAANGYQSTQEKRADQFMSQCFGSF